MGTVSYLPGADRSPVNQSTETADRVETSSRAPIRLNRAVLLGGLAAIVAGVAIVPNAVENSKDAAVMDRLKASGEHTLADFNDGKLEGLGLVKVTPHNGNQSSFAAATALTKEGEDILHTQDAIVSQTGETVEDEFPLVLPSKLVNRIDDNQATGPAAAAGSLPELPNDPEIHVR